MRTLLPNESDVSLLPPIVPAFLFHRRGGAITVRPRAELDPSSAEQLNSRRDSNGSSSTSGNVNKSGGDVPIRFTLPTGFRGSIGMGVGGGLFVSKGALGGA